MPFCDCSLSNTTSVRAESKILLSWCLGGVFVRRQRDEARTRSPPKKVGKHFANATGNQIENYYDEAHAFGGKWENISSTLIVKASQALASSTVPV